MSDTLNWTYKKNRGKKYIIGELRENNWEEGHYDENTDRKSTRLNSSH